MMETSRKKSELRLNVRYNGRQMEIQKKNLVAVCRLSVKSLIDASCSEPILEDIPAVQNFCIILEHILSHRFKAHHTWYGANDNRTFWEFIRVSCKNLPHNCLSNIQAVEQFHTSRGKGRAWIRMALMEKRLAEYLAATLQHNKILKSYYYEGATILSEDFQVLVGVILGLNAIDFSFDLRHINLDFPTLPIIDFTPYLKFEQGYSESPDTTPDIQRQEEEPVLPILVGGDTVPKERFCKLEENYRVLTEQKGYIEELVRLRESQIEEIQRNQTHLVATLKHYENESRRERRELESVIIELQAQLSAMKQEQQAQRGIVQTMHYDPLNQVVTRQQQPQVTLSLSDVSDSPTNYPGSETRLKQPWSDNRSVLSADNRSVLSGSSISVNREDTQSMEPLAGSFTSDRSFLSNQVPPPPPAAELISDDSAAANQHAADVHIPSESQSDQTVEQETTQTSTEAIEEENTVKPSEVTDIGEQNDYNDSTEVIAPVFVAINEELKINQREDSPKPDLVATCEAAIPVQQDDDNQNEDCGQPEATPLSEPPNELPVSP